MAREAPSKTLLLARREERRLVTEGRAVLEERRDLVARQMMQLIHALKATDAELAQLRRDAMKALQRGTLRYGALGLTRFAADGTPLVTDSWSKRNYFGSILVDGPEKVDTFPEKIETGGWESSVELDQAIAAFQRLLLALAERARQENNLLRLTRAFRRVQRRVNAIEQVLIPELDVTIREMEATLDEMERESLVRSLLAKRKLEKTKGRGTGAQ
jgi:V/A-type H+-transporting ATPase subunit D